MPLQATSGAASYDAFGGGVAAVPNYIEDVFSTYLYTGTGSALTVTNGIDLAGKGGLVWVKRRDTAVNNFVFDTARGVGNYLITNSTGAQSNLEGVSAFNSNGFSVGTAITTGMNTSGGLYASWTFREQPKFFDVVTFTSNGSNTQAISHSLGSVPGCIILKRTDSTQNWIVWHRGDGTTDRYSFSLNNTSAANSSGSTFVSSGYINSTSFQPNRLEDYLGSFPVSGGTYVAYLFAHDAGGFGLTGTDNVISCGSYTGNGSATGPTVTLGYEPQWLLTKRTDLSADWQLVDTMRGMSSAYNRLFPNSSAVEDFESDGVTPTATGFKLTGVQPTHNASGGTYIYIAIRRGPMKVPTSGTSVFSPIAANNAQGTQNTTGFPVDLQMQTFRGGVSDHYVVDRLRGVSTNATNTEKYLVTNTTAAEASNTILTQYWNNTGFQTSSGWASGSTIYWNFGRAPSFMDVVCYTANSSLNTNAPDSGLLVSHSLGVVPELIIIKDRIASAGTNANWAVWYTGLATQYPNGRHILLNSNAATVAATTNTFFNGTGPTSTQFRVWNNGNNATDGYVAYLFATCAGVSKVGSYTGTGTTKQIDCGFTGGARFVLIKRTDSTGDWYVWDSARGIVAGNDPYLLLNSTAAEVTSTDYIDTYSAGFEISSTAPAAINASGGTFIFLAIA